MKIKFSLLVMLFVCTFPLFGQSREDLTRELREVIEGGSGRDRLARAESLLEAGADPNGTYNPEVTFLTQALSQNNVRLVRLLLDYGAVPVSLSGDRFDVTDDRGRSPLMKEEYGLRAISILEWEEKNSPHFSAQFENRREYLTAILGRVVASAGYIWNTPSHEEIVRDAMVKRLLNRGADAAAIHYNNSIIIYAAQNFPQCIPLLVGHGALVNVTDDKYGRTPLMYVVDNLYPNNSVIDFLLKAGADPNLQSNSGETALMHARSEDAVALLLEHGADPNLQDEFGNIALLRRAFTSPAIQMLLLQGGADAAHTDKEGNTALHNWYYHADVPLLEALLARGCPLDAPNDYGITPLMKVCEHYNDSAILLLLEKGADASRCDNRGESVLNKYLGAISSNYYKFDRDKPKSDSKTVVAALLAAGARPADTDDRGDSTLLVAARLAREYKEMRPVLDMIRKHGNTGERKTAKAVISQERWDYFEYRYWPKYILPALVTFIFPLVLGGLSIVMREKVYRSNRSQNWMGPVNVVLGMGMVGLVLGVLLMWKWVAGSSSGGGGGLAFGAIADFIFVVGGGFFGGGVGLTIGAILAALPAIRKTANNNPVLYYAPTVMIAIIAGVVIFGLRS